MKNRREYQSSMFKVVNAVVMLFTLAFTPSLKAQIAYIDAKDFIVGDSIPADSVTTRTTSNPTGMYYDDEKGSLQVGDVRFGSEIGAYSFSSGISNQISGSNSVAFGIENKAIANMAIAIGESNEVEGFGSIAIGGICKGKGAFSLAMGSFSQAIGQQSIAIGNNARGIGVFTTAIGRSVYTRSYNSIAIGAYNMGIGSTTEWNATDPILEVGNGIDTINRSNALTILKNGTFLSNTHELPGNSATQNLMLFDTETGSFRAGNLNNSSAWTQLGLGSFATGENNVSSGINSAAFGFNTQSLGESTTTFGSSTSALNDNATAFGESSTAGGKHGFAVGHGSKADSRTSFVIGQYNIGGGNPEDWTGTDPLFEIGNGISNAQRANALLMRKDGRTIFGKRNFALQDRLTVNSEAGEPSFRVQVNNQTKLRVHGNGSVTLGLNNTNVSSNDVYIANDLGIGIDSAEARLDVNGNSIIRGNSQVSGNASVMGDAIVNGNSLVAGNSLVTGNSIVELNSGGNNGPHLELHETSTTDFARLMFTNENPETYWTLAGRPSSTIANSIFNIYLDGVGNVMSLRGSGRVGIGISNPSQKLEVNGAVKIGDSEGTPENGTLRYGSNGLEVYDNDRWNEVKITPKKLEIGDEAYGGVIFWLDEKGEHGLVVSTSDLSVRREWGTETCCYYSVDGNGIYSGARNTQLIIENTQGSSVISAAKACQDYRGGGYGDWYLPSGTEFVVLSNASTTLNNITLTNGNYWTSYEEIVLVDVQARSRNGVTGSTQLEQKTVLNYVRPIRRF